MRLSIVHRFLLSSLLFLGASNLLHASGEDFYLKLQRFYLDADDRLLEALFKGTRQSYNPLDPNFEKSLWKKVEFDHSLHIDFVQNLHTFLEMIQGREREHLTLDDISHVEAGIPINRKLLKDRQTKILKSLDEANPDAFISNHARSHLRSVLNNYDRASSEIRRLLAIEKQRLRFRAHGDISAIN